MYNTGKIMRPSIRDILSEELRAKDREGVITIPTETLYRALEKICSLEDELDSMKYDEAYGENG